MSKKIEVNKEALFDLIEFAYGEILRNMLKHTDHEVMNNKKRRNVFRQKEVEEYNRVIEKLGEDFDSEIIDYKDFYEKCTKESRRRRDVIVNRIKEN